MGGGSGRGPSQIGGISGQGGGRILPGTGGGVGEIFLVSPRLTATAAPGYPDYRPDPLYGEPIVTVFAAPGGGPGQSGKGDLFTVFTALKTDGTVTPITSSSGGGGGWGAAGGTGLAPSSVALEVVAGGNPGAAGGKAINTNGHAVTWLAGSARTYGAVG
jgi:hypothetical protein